MCTASWILFLVILFFFVIVFISGSVAITIFTFVGVSIYFCILDNSIYIFDSVFVITCIFDSISISVCISEDFSDIDCISNIIGLLSCNMASGRY
jgi:hypothetical protein